MKKLRPKLIVKLRDMLRFSRMTKQEFIEAALYLKKFKKA
jgi:hypothetical protein